MLHADSVRWYVRGDREKMAELLRGVEAIGKKRAQGYGRVSGWGIRQVDEDHSFVGPKGQPMRPVPHDQFSGDTSYPITEAAWKPAYYDPANRAAYYAPNLH